MTAYPSRSGRTLGPTGTSRRMVSPVEGHPGVSYIPTPNGAVVFRDGERVGTVTRGLSYGWVAEAGGTSWPVSGDFAAALASVVEVVA